MVGPSRGASPGIFFAPAAQRPTMAKSCSMDDLQTSDAPLAPDLVAAATATLEQVTQRLTLERALVLVDDGQGWKVGAAHALPTENFWLVAPVSRTVLQSGIEAGHPLMLVDAMDSDYNRETSVVLSGVRSVACAPITDQNGRIRALIYADHLIQKGAFKPHDLDVLAELADELGQQLFPS